MVRIPEEYQEVEYIESTTAKGEWINTGIIPNKDMRVVVHGITCEDVRSASFIFGSRTTNNSKMFCGLIWARQYEFELGNRRNVGVMKANVVERFYYDFNCDENHRVIVNGVAYGNSITITDSESQYTLPMLLFAIYTGTSIDWQRAPVRISNFVVYESYADTNPIQNFIPCYRKSDNEIGMYDTVTGTFFTNQGTGTFLKGNDVTYDTVNLMESRRRILLNTPHLESLTGSALSFKTDMTSKLKECRIHFTPIQEGTGDPSPDNVRPISGWDGVTVTRCGKNLFANQNGSKSYIGLKAGVTYTISYRADSNAYFRGINENGSYITNIIWMNTGVINERRYGRITPSIDIPYGVIYRSAGLSEAQIEVGSEATSYEPYDSTTLTIPFPQTIYGGYVDLVKGEVVEEWEKITLDGVTTDRKVNRDYTNTESLACGVVYLKPYGKQDNQRVTNLLCENMTIIAPSQTAEYPYIRTISSGYQYLRIFMGPIGDYTDLDTAQKRIAYVNSYLSENPTTVCYPLMNPNTYPLDPVTIRTLKGLNNIWSNANGNIEVKFWTH